MFRLCASLASFRCWVATVDVLKRMRSRRFSAAVSGWDSRVSEIMELIFETKIGSWYRVFLTLGYPLPVLNLDKFMESVTALWSVLTGGGSRRRL